MKIYRIQIAVVGREQALVIRADSRHLNDASEHVFTDDLGDPIAWVPASIVIAISES